MILDVHAKRGDTPLDFLAVEDKKKYYCCKLNDRIHELAYKIEKEGDYKIQYFDLTSKDSCRIYETSIRYLVSMAVREINPKIKIRFFYNISRSIFCKVIQPKGYIVTKDFVAQVEAKLHELVCDDVLMERKKISKAVALEEYKNGDHIDKIKMLKYRSEDFVHLYIANHNGKVYADYLYEEMVPSTGYLKDFKIRLYNPGFVIQVPRSECMGTIPPFKDEIVFATSLTNSYKWAEENQLDTVVDTNHFIKKHSAMSLINLSESKFNNLLAELGDNIVNNRDGQNARLICVAGPSSSGKTSFANRLLYELMARGLRPIRISIDNFYIPKKSLDPKVDIESLQALDVDYFDDLILKLLQGDEVDSPMYDFKTGERKFVGKLKIDENQPIIIEGIHALNPKMTESVPDYLKYKIYIAPQPQVNIDNHTPVSMTDMRLLRRIARDSRTRGSDALETITMWPNVRAGEFNYIYPTQEYADFVFDSFLPYEPCALRNIVLPLLDNIKQDSPQFTVAHRLKAMLKYYLPISLEDIPCNSLLREFVGGSSFKDAR